MFRNRARGEPTLVFRPIERCSRTFFGLSPISNVKFGLLGGAMAQWPPPSTRPWMELSFNGSQVWSPQPAGIHRGLCWTTVSFCAVSALWLQTLSWVNQYTHSWLFTDCLLICQNWRLVWLMEPTPSTIIRASKSLVRASKISGQLARASIWNSILSPGPISGQIKLLTFFLLRLCLKKQYHW